MDDCKPSASGDRPPSPPSSTTYRSSEHAQQAVKSLARLRNDDTLCDVTLVAGESRIRAHRVWLASCSHYFRAMFTTQLSESELDEIQLMDIDQTTLRTLVDFCYTGEVIVNDGNVQHLLSASAMLQMHEVQGFCCEFLIKQLSAENCLGIRRFADLHSCKDLYRAADKFMRSHMNKVLTVEEFIQLPVDLLCDILADDELDVVEEAVFDAVVKWVNYEVEERRSLLAMVMEHIRLSQCSKQFLVHIVSENDLVRDNMRCRDLLDEAKNCLLLPAEIMDTKNERCRPRVPAREAQFLYAVGGWCSGDAMSSVERMDSRSSEWKTVRPMNKRRCGVGVASLGKCLYAVGGHDGSKYLKCVERYDPMKNEWFTDITSTSTSRTSVGVTVLNNCLYAVGGQDGVSCLNVVELFDAHRNQWIKVAPMQTKRLGVSVSVMNGCLYAVGGADGQSPLNTVERYDPRIDKWMSVKPMSTRRKHLGSAVLRNHLFAVGGRADNCELQSAEKFDPVMDEWLPVVSLNNRRSGVGLAVVNGQLYAIGGFDGCAYLKSVEVLEEGSFSGLDDLTSSPHWRTAGSMAFRRLGGGVAVISMTKDEINACMEAEDSASSSDPIRTCFADLAV